jgi:hypothetical protein
MTFQFVSHVGKIIVHNTMTIYGKGWKVKAR